MVYWIVGLSGAGKTTLANALCEQLKKQTPAVVVVDGDVVRKVWGEDEALVKVDPYSLAGRRRNADRICNLCHWLDLQGVNVVCAVLSVFEESRRWNRKNYSKYCEIYIRASISFLEKERDYKGIYAASRSGKMKNVIGIDIPFSEPSNPDLVFDAEELAVRNVEEVARLVVPAEKGN